VIHKSKSSISKPAIAQGTRISDLRDMYLGSKMNLLVSVMKEVNSSSEMSPSRFLSKRFISEVQEMDSRRRPLISS
jgi:hypothetical protein